MATPLLKFKLAKVLIAAAWADGRLANEELNTLKDFLFGLPEIGQEDWKKLMVYMESPVAEDEAGQLVKDLMLEVRGGKDRRLVIDTLRRLAEADGDVSASEQDFIATVEAALKSAGGGFFGKLGNNVRRVLRRKATTSATEREEQISDYINNEVFHYLVHVKKRAATIRLPEADVRRMCLAAGLTCWVLHSDLVIDSEDRMVLERLLLDDWGVTVAEAEAVADAACDRIVKGVDFNRLCRTYFEAATPDEARALAGRLDRMASAASHGRDKKRAGAEAVRKALKLQGA